MAVNTIYAPVEAAGNGVTTAYAFAFKIASAADLVVRKKAADGTYSAALTNGVDFTVVFDPIAETGTVTYTVAPVSGGASNIGRDSDSTQGTVYPREGTLPAKTTENGLDKLTMLEQELDYRISLITIQTSPIQSGAFATLDAAAVVGTPFFAIVTDSRTFQVFTGNRSLGTNGWATIGGY